MIVKLFCVVMLMAMFVHAEDYSSGARAILRVYDECNKSEGGFSPCLKKKAITFMDRVTKIESINFLEGVKVTRSVDATSVAPKPVTEAELEQTLPRGIEARDDALTNILLDRVSRFFNGRAIQINLPNISANDLGRGVEEGRGKMKKMMSMMMMGMMMKMAAMIPVAMAGLYLLAGKALIVSKIALLLAGILGIKKLMESKKKEASSSGWAPSGGAGGGGGGHGGWDRRSIEAQNLAYKAYAANQVP